MTRTSLNQCKTADDPAACRYCGAAPEMTAKLAALETELAAWRALAEWERADYRSVVVEHKDAFQGFVLSWLDEHDTGGSVCADSAGAAAIALARQLKLIPEAK